MFDPLPSQPDSDALEREILDLWEREGTFELLRAQNRGGPTWSFVDGPVTANKKLAVHTAWGRTLKDVFQRYKAMRGFDQRYQNGFDCQGLWIEVGVERQLGLNSKREIEEFGLEEFAHRCRAVVVKSAEELTRGCIRLGQWMDWGNDYFTFSDTNIEYIWRFLKIVNERGWLYVGHRATEWCPRCGTSLSQHELTQSGVYQEKSDPSLYVRFPLLDRDGESVVVWTTTPWTLPANVAAAVNPAREYGLPRERRVGARRAVSRRRVRPPRRRHRARRAALPRARSTRSRRAPASSIASSPGTRCRSTRARASSTSRPGCGGEDFELGRSLGLPVLTPVDEAGRFYDDYGWLHGLSTIEAADQIVGDLAERGLARRGGHVPSTATRTAGAATRRSSSASPTTGSSPSSDVRQPLLDANATVEWMPEYMGKRMDDWLRNMGDWNISRRRYYGLPLPFYPCSCGHLNVIGSQGRAGRAGDRRLERPRASCAGRGSTGSRSAARQCGEAVERDHRGRRRLARRGDRPVLDARLAEPGVDRGGLRDRRRRGPDARADLPDHAYWEKWFPADWVSEMREQIRLWFYSQLFMSVVLVGKAPFRRVLGYEKMLDERGREMHGSWGNMIDAEEAFERMGADVMRWQYCAQPPDRNLLFGFGPAHEIKRKLLTLLELGRRSSSPTGTSRASSRARRPRRGPGRRAAPLDRWLVARTRRSSSPRRRAAYEATLTVNVIRAFEAFVDDLSNWYIRRSRRRFYGDDEAAFRDALVRARPGAARDRARDAVPRRPPVAEPRRGAGARRRCTWRAGPSRRRAGPRRCSPRSPRSAASSSSAGRLARRRGLKLRQPLRRLVVAGAPLARGARGRDRRRAARARRRVRRRSRRPSCA